MRDLTPNPRAFTFSSKFGRRALAASQNIITKKKRVPRTPTRPRKIAAVKQKSHDMSFVAADSFFGLFVLGTKNFNLLTQACQIASSRIGKWIAHPFFGFCANLYART